MGEMAAQAGEMERLREAISSKAGPLKLAQTRLNMRTQKIRRSAMKSAIYTLVQVFYIS